MPSPLSKLAPVPRAAAALLLFSAWLALLFAGVAGGRAVHLLLLAALVLFPWDAKPQPRPGFSGTWTMNREKSRLQITPPDSTVFRIEHKEPTFELTRTHAVKGVADTFSITLTTDGRETVTTVHGRVLHSRCFWEGDRLVFDSRIGMDEGEATNLVRYSLSADAGTLTAEERFRSHALNYDNLWVFDRGSGEG